MASRRLAASIATQLAGAAALAGAIVAARFGLYATTLVAALAAAWLGATQISAATRAGVRLPGAAAPPRADEALLLQALLEATPTPLVLLEPQGGFRAVNRAARALFRTEGAFTPPSDLAQALRERAAHDRTPLRLGDGASSRLYALTLADISARGAVSRLGALTDVQTEVYAAEADALRRLMQVLGHELMNSLTPIASLAETAGDLLARDPAVGAGDALAAMRTIERRASGLQQFVEGYRTLARLPPPRPRPTDLGLLVEDAARLLGARGGASAEVVLERPDAPIVWRTDPDLVGQALANLLLNASEAARSGSRPPSVRLRLRVFEGRPRIDVDDSGEGVRREDAESIFLPFVTTKSQGSGIGLHLARSALRSLGGDVILQFGDEARTSRFVLIL